MSSSLCIMYCHPQLCFYTRNDMIIQSWHVKQVKNIKMSREKLRRFFFHWREKWEKYYVIQSRFVCVFIKEMWIKWQSSKPIKIQLPRIRREKKYSLERQFYCLIYLCLFGLISHKFRIWNLTSFWICNKFASYFYNSQSSLETSNYTWNYFYSFFLLLFNAAFATIFTWHGFVNARLFIIVRMAF